MKVLNLRILSVNTRFAHSLLPEVTSLSTTEKNHMLDEIIVKKESYSNNLLQQNIDYFSFFSLVLSRCF